MPKVVFSDGVHNILFVISIIVFIFSIYSFVGQLYAAFDFTVLEVGRLCEAPLNNRCTDSYKIKKSDGGLGLVTPPGYRFRGEDLIVGNHLEKKKFELNYRVNGINTPWGYFTLHLVGVIAGMAMFLIWQFLSRRNIQQ